MSAAPAPDHLSRRRFVQGSLGLALAGGSALAASGCSSSTSGGSAAKSLSFFSWDTQTNMQPVYDLFKKQSGLNLTVSFAPPVEQYVSTLQTHLESGTAADAFILTAENKNIVAGGFVKDISEQPMADTMNSANREFMTVGGKVYGLSVSSWAGGIMYNKELLAKAGATSLPDSWDGFLTLCAKLKSLGITPYSEAPGEGNCMSLWGLVGGYFADQGHFPDQDIFDGKTTFADTWTTPLVAWSRLYTEGLVPQSILGLKTDDVVRQFANGQVAMFGAGTWNVPAVQKISPHLAFETEAIPGVNKGTTYWTGAPNIGYAINAKAKNPEAALTFLQFLASPDGLRTLGTALGAITTTGNYTPTVDRSVENQARGARSGRIYLGVVHWPRHAPEINTELSNQTQAMIRGTIKPQDIAAGLDKKLKELDAG
jgi:raffinose/stachyose/melibiose transport system substrate-binding protein